MATATPSIRTQQQPTPQTHNTSECPCLLDIKTKVCDLVQSRWAVVAALGLAIALLVSPVMGLLAAGASALVAWEFTPVATAAQNLPKEVNKDPGTIVAFQANVLGGDLDVFEFKGKYDPETTATKAEVAAEVVAPTAAKANTKKAVSPEEIQAEFKKGPTLGEVISSDLWAQIKPMAVSRGFAENKLAQIEQFLSKYKNAKLFRFFRNCPPGFLSLDQNLRLHAKKPENNFKFDLPILNSPAHLLSGRDAKLGLANAILTPVALLKTEDLHAVRAGEGSKMQKFFAKTTPEELRAMLQGCLGESGVADPKDIACFESDVGQVVFYLLYQMLNQHMVQQKEGLIERINVAKDVGARTIGNPVWRAEVSQQKMKAAGAEVIFTQECDAHFAKAMHEINFHNTDKQQSLDGCKIFLSKDSWLPGYFLLSRLEADNSGDEKATCMIATHKETQTPFLLASLHGSAKRAKNAMDMIQEVFGNWQTMRKENPDLLLMIGIDANTQTPAEEKAFLEMLDGLGLEASRVGITCAKEREVTCQHDKAHKPDLSSKDFLIVPKGQIALTNQTVAFSAPPLDKTVMLPNINNPSDHAAVGAYAKIVSMMANNPQGAAFQVPRERELKV